MGENPCLSYSTKPLPVIQSRKKISMTFQSWCGKRLEKQSSCGWTRKISSMGVQSTNPLTSTEFVQMVPAGTFFSHQHPSSMLSYNSTFPPQLCDSCQFRQFHCGCLGQQTGRNHIGHTNGRNVPAAPSSSEKTMPGGHKMWLQTLCSDKTKSFHQNGLSTHSLSRKF